MVVGGIEDPILRKTELGFLEGSIVQLYQTDIRRIHPGQSLAAAGPAGKIDPVQLKIIPIRPPADKKILKASCDIGDEQVGCQHQLGGPRSRVVQPNLRSEGVPTVSGGQDRAVLKNLEGSERFLHQLSAAAGFQIPAVQDRSESETVVHVIVVAALDLLYGVVQYTGANPHGPGEGGGTSKQHLTSAAVRIELHQLVFPGGGIRGRLHGKGSLVVHLTLPEYGTVEPPAVVGESFCGSLERHACLHDLQLPLQPESADRLAENLAGAAVQTHRGQRRGEIGENRGTKMNKKTSNLLLSVFAKEELDELPSQ